MSTGISAKRLSGFEHREEVPDGDEILILVDYYKCDFRFFISSEKVAAFEQTEHLFRMYRNEDRWSIQEALYLAECEAFLINEIGRETQRKFTFIKKGNYYKGHGEYECLFKQRKSTSSEKLELQGRLKKEQSEEHFHQYLFDIEDLQDVDVLTKRKNLSKGELSPMVFAKKTKQAFLTDDQGARKLASQFMDSMLVQTTPRLFGWLIYNEYLNDTDVHLIIQEHKQFNRPLSPYLMEVYKEAMKFRLLKKAE